MRASGIYADYRGATYREVGRSDAFRSTDKDIVDLTPEQIADLITRAVQAGRFKDAPVDPASLVD